MTNTDYEALKGKKVDIELTDGTVYERATLLAGSDIGVVFKPRGSSTSEIAESHKIASITTPKVGPKVLRSRRLPAASLPKVREHLALHHGYKLSEINAMTDEAALAFHETLDHEDLGHVHREPTEAEKALAEMQAQEQAALDAED